MFVASACMSVVPITGFLETMIAILWRAFLPLIIKKHEILLKLVNPRERQRDRTKVYQYLLMLLLEATWSSKATIKIIKAKIDLIIFLLPEKYSIVDIRLFDRK